MEDDKLNQESDLRVCKQCGEKKMRIRSGSYHNGKDKKYVDINGRQWSGSVCPSCHAHNCKERQKLQRILKKEGMGG